MDAWGSNDVWGSSAPSQPAATSTSHAQPTTPGWGAPQVTQDDDFGGWSSAAPTTTSNTTQHTSPHTQSKPAGGFGGGSDDLFSNVWE
jgi:stromal membrane-associated protein